MPSILLSSTNNNWYFIFCLLKIETIHLSIDPYFKKLRERDKIRNELGLPGGKRLLLSVSTNVKRKNLNIIGKTMKLLTDNFALVRVGESIGKSITFQNVSKEKLNKIYNACDVLLMPSIEEGLGLPFLQYLLAITIS